MDDLLPCPFCGEMPEVENTNDYVIISCSCKLEPGTCGDINTAIAAWNTRAAPCWIPVSERLPEVDVPVLVIGENCYNQKVVVVRHLTDFGWYDENDDYLMAFVTHWMPLPEPPKEVEG